jgi:hypothetical protein
MGQFKPMVKMETTEPSVVLKLKKGGTVAHKPMKGKEDNQKPVKKAMGGGLGAMMSGAPMMSSAEEMPTSRAPARPSMAQRRKAMMANKMRSKRPMPEMAMEAPMKKGGKTMATGGLSNPMKKGGKAKCMATGGIANAMATGGLANPMKKGGSSDGIRKGNKGGYKTGGAPKKFANGGSAVAMPQGNKKASPPVAINMLSGTYKKGGKVKKYKDGDSVVSDKPSFDESFQDPKSQMAEMRRMKNLAKGEGAISEAEREMASGLGLADRIGSLYNKAKAAIKGPSVTDSKTTVSRTVSPPAKKRGGRC